MQLIRENLNDPHTYMWQSGIFRGDCFVTDVGLCVLGCRVGMLGTNWLNLDIYRLSINLIMFSQE